MARLLFFAGSARKESMNKKLAKLAADVASQAGADVTLVDLSDYEMPLYDGDLEATVGVPENAIKLKQLFIEHAGFFIASPEYNSSIPPLLKNTLDWISRPQSENEPSLIAYRGKVAALGAVSPGGLGGIRGLVPLRLMLGNIGVTVVPSQVAIGFGGEAFDAEGELKDPSRASMLQATVKSLVNLAQQISGSAD